MPLPALHHRPGEGARPTVAPAAWRLTRMMDQHAFMETPPDADLQVGDLLAFDISHPCLTFDKWRQLLLVDDDYRVRGAVETFF
jgi:D-serine dehydratase